MKELMKESAKLIVGTVLVLLAFFGFMGLVALMINGITFLPPYIGGFGTFLLYVAIYAIMFVAIYEFAKKQK